MFGYDRQLYDNSGEPVQRISFRQKFRKPATWRSELVPSDEHSAVEAVQWIFEAIQSGEPPVPSDRAVADPSRDDSVLPKYIRHGPQLPSR